VTGLGEVVEDEVRDVLIECAVVAELLKVMLEGFEFDAEPIGDVNESQGAKIGLTGFGTHGGEFGADGGDGVVAVGELILEGFEESVEVWARGVGGHGWSLRTGQGREWSHAGSVTGKIVVGQEGRRGLGRRGLKGEGFAACEAQARMGEKLRGRLTRLRTRA